MAAIRHKRFHILELGNSDLGVATGSGNAFIQSIQAIFIEKV